MKNNRESNVQAKDAGTSKYWDDMKKQNGFTLLEQLGKGSFGTVMKAQCKETKEEFAIKLIENPFKNIYHAR